MDKVWRCELTKMYNEKQIILSQISNISTTITTMDSNHNCYYY